LSRTSARKPRRRTGSRRTESAPRDYVTVAIEYARAAVADKKRKRFGKWFRRAARRFLADLRRARAKRAPFHFDRWHANDACGFIEKLPHVEGTWSTSTLTLHAAHVFFVVNIFGFRKPDGTRRFDTALLAIARKNAKSTLAAAILLYCMCCEDEAGAQLLTAATTGSQARIVFDYAKKMVLKTPDLREAFAVEPFANAVARWHNGASLKPINAKASTQDGLNPSHTVLDEIHAHKTHDLLNVLRSAAGARRNPLWLFTTTEGYENPGPWQEQRQFAHQILTGKVQADHYFAVIFSVDDDDDDFDERAWRKANPLIEVNKVLLGQIRTAAVDAKHMPGNLAEFRIKRLNRQSSTAKGWIRFANWKACAKPVDLEMLRGHPCWGGLDLASTTDLCSFRLVWKLEGRYYTWGRRWVPEHAVQQRTIRATVPYAAWAAAGLLERTPGEVIDHDVIERAVREAHERFRVKVINYDAWNAAQLTEKLKNAGVPMEQFIQGPKSYHPAMQEFERAYIAGNLSHGGDPVLTWCASNIVVRYDVNLNMAPDKKRSADKIDDMVALMMAFGGAVRGVEGASKAWDVVTV
jgi:phage terminase large subunit-like protein